MMYIFIYSSIGSHYKHSLGIHLKIIPSEFVYTEDGKKGGEEERRRGRWEERVRLG